jgi:hypothetical protein
MKFLYGIQMYVITVEQLRNNLFAYKLFHLETL